MTVPWSADPFDQPAVSLSHSNPQAVVPSPTRSRPVQVRGTPEPIALHDSPLPGPWKKQALCRGMDPDLFFPHRGTDQSPVMEVCAACPVQRECREYSLGVGALLRGIWGGENERQRRRERTERARELAALKAAQRAQLEAEAATQTATDTQTDTDTDTRRTA